MNQELREHRKSLFEEASVALHEIDAEGVIRSVNQAERRLLGYAEEEIIGHYVWEFVAAEHRETARAAIARKVSREQPVSVVCREYRRHDGTYLWVEIHEHLIENAEGQVVGIRSAMLDITERYHFDARIQKQFDWMRYVLGSLATAIVTADALGHIDFMNPAAEAITGWQLADALRRPLEEVCQVRREPGEPVDLMSCVLAESAISNRSRNFQLVDRSGASHGVSWIISPILNDSGVMIGAALTIEKR